MGKKVSGIQFNLHNRGRTYTGKPRNYDVAKIVAAINGPVMQEHVKLDGLMGYYGHGIRLALGLRPEEGGAVISGRVRNAEPAVKTTRISATPEGVVSYDCVFLDTAAGKIAESLHNSKTGGFSSVLDDRRPELIGFDYVLRPNFTDNRGYAMDDAGEAVTDGICLDATDTPEADIAAAIQQEWDGQQAALIAALDSACEAKEKAEGEAEEAKKSKDDAEEEAKEAKAKMDSAVAERDEALAKVQHLLTQNLQLLDMAVSARVRLDAAGPMVDTTKAPSSTSDNLDPDGDGDTMNDVDGDGDGLANIDGKEIAANAAPDTSSPNSGAVPNEPKQTGGDQKDVKLDSAAEEYLRKAKSFRDIPDAKLAKIEAATQTATPADVKRDAALSRLGRRFFRVA